MYALPPSGGNPLDWGAVAAGTRLPTFPIRIRREGEKWTKVPLTQHGHKDASWKASAHDWSFANGFGIPMGQVGSAYGLYAFDVDDHKGGEAAQAPWDWLRRWEVPFAETRQHRTVSGGLHLIFSLPKAHLKLPTRTGIVPGLDSRGEGGWIAFGEGYRLVLDLAPALLSDAVCAEIIRGYTGAGGGAGVGAGVDFEIPDYVEPDGTAVDRKLAVALSLAKRSRKRAGPAKLVERYLSGQKREGDTSTSAVDMSLAALLVRHGMTFPEIVFILLHRFEHGLTARDGLTPTTLRAAQRCAGKAVAAREAQLRAELRVLQGPSAAAVSAFGASLK